MEAFETRTLSPKELADIVGVSESSIKRWVDDGLIDVMRTAGGHRRILLSEALRFIRAEGMHMVRPELLGLTDLSGLPPEAREGALTGDVLFQLLRRGEASRTRGLIAHHFLSGTSLADLFDGPVAEALATLGELWKHGEEGIYVEHMATTICIEAVNQLRLLIPPVEAGAPVALGGAPPGDPYMLPGLMASAVLAEAGYSTINLGPDTPYAAFLHAVEIHRPELVWLALTAHCEDGEVERLIRFLLGPLEERGVRIAMGGSQAMAGRKRWPHAVVTLSSMAELSAYVAAQKSA